MFKLVFDQADGTMLCATPDHVFCRDLEPARIDPAGASVRKEIAPGEHFYDGQAHSVMIV